MPDLLSEVRRTKILAILRGVPARHAPKLVETLRGAGTELFEVALSDDLGLPSLRAIRAAFPDLTLGAGTVVTPDLARQAQGAGATFLVTPHLVPDVNAYAREHGLGLLSGALTPTEIYTAHTQGSAAVKVFPASSLGPDYFRQLRGPYPHLPLLAVGGVDARNLKDYLQAGAVGAGVGGALTRADWTNPDWAGLRRRAAELMQSAQDGFIPGVTL
ncbi:bifunctional 4-hydroxy-2-oxoglutarate aldolase/2-dehydro-3-deoxy-phosphogluconate aldolase (plasmid) [Deinococcus metallilatus]|uniref:2-dehydro-3-deoxyphosphogluconate aldolase/(4S)-4-hydroxy-2-oxoglutarate aldolase n=1 Tax=Deinococcus metallilatus TaxID=1211322 RepID=A0ABR6MYC0_9DEIO|nr:bifunctional 4-hydroxy-2-oxoglutarate aldolase/2-dehydro-3-deoxy-phosphogluconate aldolase [Deinococcus metallilatus]MBB5296941.1 2-dehydro-3-deoxyphosphogluconate aldolase/(4S)-4-hydroxy-2-oxoglutarate aldolase [Deinococcus metallilatus]QBY06691.1 bifunctional 4-hydroxy-2-oxoglutarate aldolase/2-dehydro-3-deoxy-phosphogluconate aldolase [Deinococcus metallilatus]GMA15160.1 2-keto-3-deoxy-phosphogluconate aldolase [Deinococcus metallilatus]